MSMISSIRVIAQEVGSYLVNIMTNSQVNLQTKYWGVESTCCVEWGECEVSGTCVMSKINWGEISTLCYDLELSDIYWTRSKLRNTTLQGHTIYTYINICHTQDGRGWNCYIVYAGPVFFHFDLVSSPLDHYFLVGWGVGPLPRSLFRGRRRRRFPWPL